jgi:endonuclease-3
MSPTKLAAKTASRSPDAARSAAFRERKARAGKIVAYLKKAYPKPKSELAYKTPYQFVVAVILSAQCTDKAVNKLTAALFKRYKTPRDFAKANPAVFTKELSSIPFFRNKAKAIIGAAKVIVQEHKGDVPHAEAELVALPGVGYKTAHVILGELFDEWEGIATDTHVKRFAQRFDLTDVKNGDLKKISKELEELVPRKDWKYVNNGLVLYGRYQCPARPHDCTSHPLTKIWPQAAQKWPKAK